MQIKRKDLSKITWKGVLSKAVKIRFSDAYFTESSGRGRAHIQDAILVAIGVKQVDDVRNPDFARYLSEMIGHNHA